MNPFEIRAKMIEHAQEYLTKQFETNTDFAKRAFEELVAQGEKVAGEWQSYAPKMFTFEDVIKEAQKLYGFVKDVK